MGVGPFREQDALGEAVEQRWRSLPIWWRASFSLAVFLAVSGAMITALDVRDGYRDAPRALSGVTSLGMLAAIALAIGASRFGVTPTPPGAADQKVFRPQQVWMIELIVWLSPAVLLPIALFLGALFGTSPLVTAGFVVVALLQIAMFVWMLGIRYEVTESHLLVRQWPSVRRIPLDQVERIEDSGGRSITVILTDGKTETLGRPEHLERFRSRVLS